MPSGRQSSNSLLKPHHRDVSGGGLRAAVFGMSDGLVSNVSLVLGVAGADPAPSIVKLAGLAGLVAGACSMAAGEYISMRAQRDVLEFELERERAEIANRPEFERDELSEIYQQRGVSVALADQLASEIMTNPEIALEIHAREELGVNPNSLGSPVRAALASFGAFTVGAAVPLMPWLFGSGTAAVVASVAGAVVVALVLGGMIGSISGRSIPRAALRQLLIAMVAAGVTFAIGNLVGVGTSST